MEADARPALPAGFVYADEAVPGALTDAKYAGRDNFMGRPADGYFAPYVVLTREAADGCARAAAGVRGEGLVLKFFDAYRPARAVRDFVRWCADPSATERKRVHYPRIDKADMLKLGYISARSGHSRGSTVDLTLARADTGAELDMGGIFDFMDERSHHDAPGLTDVQRANRARLCAVMLASGFVTIPEEWWHYTLSPEPYPDTYFDFPIGAAPGER